MKKVGIMLDDGFHDLELWIPYYRFLEEHINFEILAWEQREYKGMFGVDPVKPTRLLSSNLDDIGVIYMPGAKSPANLMKNEKTIPLVRELYENGVEMATICHSPLVLAKSGLIKGRRITGHPSIAKEISEFGVKLAPDPFIFDGQVLSGKTHYQMDEFLPQLLNIIRT
ncbi:MAG: DJ-1/PfpI family protein [Thermoplasmataceae archaeon]